MFRDVQAHHDAHLPNLARDPYVYRILVRRDLVFFESGLVDEDVHVREFVFGHHRDAHTMIAA